MIPTCICHSQIPRCGQVAHSTMTEVAGWKISPDAEAKFTSYRLNTARRGQMAFA